MTAGRRPIRDSASAHRDRRGFRLWRRACRLWHSDAEAAVYGRATSRPVACGVWQIFAELQLFVCGQSCPFRVFCARSLLLPKTAPSAPKTAASTFFCHKRQPLQLLQPSDMGGGLRNRAPQTATSAVSAVGRRGRRFLRSRAANGGLCIRAPQMATSAAAATPAILAAPVAERHKRQVRHRGRWATRCGQRSGFGHRKHLHPCRLPDPAVRLAFGFGWANKGVSLSRSCAILRMLYHGKVMEQEQRQERHAGKACRNAKDMWEEMP